MSTKKVEQNTMQPDGLPEEIAGTNLEGGAPEDLSSVLLAASGNGADGVLMVEEDVGNGAVLPDAELPVLPDDTPPPEGGADDGEADVFDPEKPAAKKAAFKKTTAKRKTKAEKAAGESAAQNTDDEVPPAENPPATDVEISETAPVAYAASEESAAPDEPGELEGQVPEGEGAEGDAEPALSVLDGSPQPDDSEEPPIAAPPPQTRRAAKASAAAPAPRPRRTTPARQQAPSVLTIENNAMVETPESREEVIWHEIHNAYRSRRILTGELGGIEVNEAKKTMAIVYYKEFRIVIPMREMMIVLPDNHAADDENVLVRQSKIMNTMLGAHIDFIVKGIDSKTRSVVASRKDAMLKKRQIFYMDAGTDGNFRITEGRVVQARVVGVAEKVVRVEVFGVECSIMARDLTWEWMGDAHERYAVGDAILVRVTRIRRDSVQDIAIRCDAKSVKSEDGSESLMRCKVQGKYAGKVTDIRRGVVMIRLSIGVNAIAHACYDHRTPGKKDDVSFVVTHIDAERGVAVGIITRIIRQNL